MRLAAVTMIVALLGGAPDADDDGQRSVILRAGADDQLIDQTIEQLEDGDVLAIVLTGGEPGEKGSVRQCVLGVTGPTSCRNHFPILFDDDGTAKFQYQVRDDGDCGADATCVVVAGTLEDNGIAFTVFGDEAPPDPDVRLSPAGAVLPGDRVRVDVSGLPSGATVQAAFCGETCRPAERSTAAGDGTAVVEVTVGEQCRTCVIVVVGGAASVRLPLTIVAPPPTSYDLRRLLAGLAAAVVFLLAAWWLVVSVDWRPPSEADTPEFEL